MSSDIYITEGVVESSCIKTIIGRILNGYYNFSSGWLRSVNANFAFTLAYRCFSNIYSNLSILVALVSYIRTDNCTGNLGSSPLAFDGALRESPQPDAKCAQKKIGTRWFRSFASWVILQ